MKTYVLLISKRFMVGHPKAGQRTFFKEKMMVGALHYEAKLHTIRGNYDYWKKVVDRVNAGEAVLSIREWKGKPYKSKQVEITQAKRLGIQRINIRPSGGLWMPQIQIDRRLFPESRFSQLACNDGLYDIDFLNWFNKDFDGCIIHFSRLHYA